MKNLLLFALVAALISCDEKEERPDPRECYQNQEGNIFVDNGTEHSYNVFVNGTLEKVVPAKTHILVPVKSNNGIPIRVEQQNGPNKRSGTVNVEVCGETLFRFE